MSQTSTLPCRFVKSITQEGLHLCPFAPNTRVMLLSQKSQNLTHSLDHWVWKTFLQNFSGPTASSLSTPHQVSTWRSTFSEKPSVTINWLIFNLIIYISCLHKLNNLNNCFVNHFLTLDLGVWVYVFTMESYCFNLVHV